MTYVNCLFLATVSGRSGLTVMFRASSPFAALTHFFHELQSYIEDGNWSKGHFRIHFSGPVNVTQAQRFSRLDRSFAKQQEHGPV